MGAPAHRSSAMVRASRAGKVASNSVNPPSTSRGGAEQAWRVLQSDYPKLARRMASLCNRDADRRAALQKRAEAQASLDAEGKLQVLAGCVLLGGYGHEPGVNPGDRVDLHFTQHGVWMTKAGGAAPYLRRPYASMLALEFEGGAVRNGGGFAGGGFGLVGAAEEMAIAALLNSLTTTTKVHTTVRLEAQSAEVFLFTDQALPHDLKVRLAEVRGRIKASHPADPSSGEQARNDVADRLLRLGEMLDKGQLTADEFAQAKAQLLAD